jgi:hypothetical protein
VKSLPFVEKWRRELKVARDRWAVTSRSRKRAAKLLVLNVGLFVVLCVVVASACGRASTSAPVVASAASATPSASAAASAMLDVDAGEPMDPRDAELWSRAANGGDEDLARLADREGSVGLVERGAVSAFRATAIRALAFVHDFEALPWLAEIAAGADDAAALAALDSIAEIAAQPRRAVDPEDGAELRAGCDALLVLAKSEKANKDRRIVAIRAIRMMQDRGCAKADAIPTELDVK